MSSLPINALDMATLVATRTLEKYAADYYPRLSQLTLNFRGDIAEKHQYDKITPLSQAQCHGGRVVVIEGLSKKTGNTSHYCIECNGWNLIEIVGLWTEPAAPSED